MSGYKYAAVNEAPIYETVQNGKGKKMINRILLGTYVKILQEDGEWYKVATAGPDGWMHASLLSDTMGLKMFFLDVGQGDGLLIEVGKHKILIDAGPDNNMYNYLTKWQYTYLLKANEKVHIDYLIVSHFDKDHYKGFIKIINDPRFTFGTIIHPGILKFAAKTNPYNSGLGNLTEFNGIKYLTQIFSNLLTVSNKVPFNRDVTAFLTAIHTAKSQGRITKAKRYEEGDVIINKNIEGIDFKMEVLAPFLEKIGNKKSFVYWRDDSKTINGHSLVIKISFGRRTFLAGGDLNSLSQNYLMEKYSRENPFEVDVAKSCHHGSSDFDEAFLNKINPYATVISSGDNESFSHPRADAIGCAGKYSKSIRPLVYATELARSTNLKGNKILFGMINLRSNGKDIYMSQMKEVRNNSDLWDSYEVG
ncbi:MAG: SH3 domain-containing protein [Niabella sp.]